MLFPASSRRHRFAPLLFALALAALLAGAARDPASAVAPSDERTVETLTVAWLYPLLAAPVLVHLVESDAP